MCITETVYCWHCGEQFKKNKYNPNLIDDFEDCPHCEKGFDDLNNEAQLAVKRTLEGIKDFK